MSDPGASTSALLAALPALEASLGQLKAKPWSETVESLDHLDRAKMDVLMSYAINDLIWVYLKLKGVDPATHEVTAELDRIKKYYTKIKSVEEPETRRTQVDKAAAHRFITAAIPRSQRTFPPPPSTSAAAQAAADAARAVGSSGDVSLAGRFRFIAQEGEKVRRTAEDAFGDEVAVDDEGESGDDVAMVEGEMGDDFEALQREFDEEVRATGDANEVEVEEEDSASEAATLQQEEKEQLEFAERHRKKKQKRAAEKKKVKA